jgi:pimeloyl-ACP methyl ester carboxylesterase
MHSILIMLSTLCKATVVCYDYSGYGSSTGVPSEAVTYSNIQTVYKFLISQEIVSDPKKELVCYGESIGSGPSIWLCSRVKLAGLILQSAIASGLRVLTDNRLLCCCDIFPNIDRIKRVKCSTFVMHGASDEQVTIRHGTRLHASLPTKHAYAPWWVVGASHNNLRQVAGEEYVQRINNFLKYVKDQNQTNDGAALVGAEKTDAVVVVVDGKESVQPVSVAGESASIRIRKTSAVVHPENISA